MVARVAAAAQGWWARLVPRAERPCPNPRCAAPTLKESGCDFLVCGACREQWCWSCGQWGGGPSGRPPPHHVFACRSAAADAWKAATAERRDELGGRASDRGGAAAAAEKSDEA